MAGVEHAFIEVVDDGAIGGHVFENSLDVFVQEETLQVINAAVNPAGVIAVCIAKVAAKVLSGDNHNHAAAQVFAGAVAGALGCHLAGGEIDVGVDVEPVAGALCALSLAGGAVVGSPGNGGKAFAVGVAALADGGAVSRHVEVHAAICRVHAFFLKELEGAFGILHPFRALFDAVVAGEEHPGHAALCPYVLVCVYQCAVSGAAMVETPVHCVQ